MALGWRQAQGLEKGRQLMEPGEGVGWCVLVVLLGWRLLVGGRAVNVCPHCGGKTTCRDECPRNERGVTRWLR